MLNLFEEVKQNLRQAFLLEGARMGSAKTTYYAPIFSST